MRAPDTTDTIVAPSTAPGGAAIAVLRVSGPRAFSICSNFLHPNKALSDPKPRLTHLLRIKDGDELIDRAVAVFYRAPASYTGDDTVELFCHGSPYILRSALTLAIRHGAREAEPGEFTLRAFLNGKLDLAEAEAVGDLIASSTRAEHAAAMRQVEGELSAGIKGFKAALVSVLADLEARLDDADSEIPAEDSGALSAEVLAARAKISEAAESFRRGRFVREGIKVAIAGAPNSGKSSLLNALAGASRAIVSHEPGTTRDCVETPVELGGHRVVFTDTAGFNPSPGGDIEAEGLRRAAAAVASADITLFVADGSAPESPGDRLAAGTIADRLPPGARVIKVLNKSDLPAAREDAVAVKVSALTGAGLDRLRAALLEGETAVIEEGGLGGAVTSARHFQALSRAADELIPAAERIRAGEPELAAEHLRAALSSLGEILGETTPDEILSEIFGRFCVGK
ncbi:MAG: tRNA uridine-5-carboxymethylaminomethyl(34) synthesis GTPase MnmE [Elusimicrobiales bacterium]|jgi:tRNA modification GTPase|nr:tRNA uridine-5-carboxymethylaminomethyl(34) synthesis GTPase MnmE [Elusimicrobiales bacterium]